MTKRPLVITIFAWLFIAVGAVGFLYHLSELKGRSPSDYGPVWVAAIRVLAVVGGVFMLRGRNWARWLLGFWMALHIGVSFFHSPSEVVMHILLFGTIGYFLFRSQAAAYFGRGKLAPGAGS